MRITQKNIDAVALFSQLTSAFAVVISLIYLTVQINDNTKALENQSHYNALSVAEAPIVMTVDNPELARIVERGYINPDSLESVEKMRFYDHQFLSFNGWEYLYYANQSESIPKSLWTGADGYFSELVYTKPGLAKFWSLYKHAFADPFKSYVENIYEKSNNKNSSKQ
jgi:hypothetical protein